VINLPEEENFIEVSTKEEANKINLEKYRFVEYDKYKGKYIFVKRSKKPKK